MCSILRYSTALVAGWILTATAAFGQDGRTGARLPVPAAAPNGKPVPAQLILDVGATIRLQMSTRKPIRTVYNNRPTIVRVDPKLDDQTTVLLTGLAPGTARITLIAVDGTTENR